MFEYQLYRHFLITENRRFQEKRFELLIFLPDSCLIIEIKGLITNG